MVSIPPLIFSSTRPENESIIYFSAEKHHFTHLEIICGIPEKPNGFAETLGCREGIMRNTVKTGFQLPLLTPLR
jgi:hypothetical protein